MEPQVSGKKRMETIREACNEYCADCGVIDLVFDGGPQNNNDTIKIFVNKEEIRINPFIALKDIPYSNSVTEAQYINVFGCIVAILQQFFPILS